MKRSLLLGAIALGLLITSAAPAFAKGKKKGTGKNLVAKFERLDTNKDGKLSLAEFEKMGKHRKNKNKSATSKTESLTKRFEKLDTNKDGFLTANEFAHLKGGKKKKAPKF